MNDLKYRLIERPLQKLPYTIAWMMPKWLAYYCTIRVIANATCDKYSNQNVAELTAMEVLKRWEDKQ